MLTQIVLGVMAAWRPRLQPWRTVRMKLSPQGKPSVFTMAPWDMKSLHGNLCFGRIIAQHTRELLSERMKELKYIEITRIVSNPCQYYCLLYLSLSLWAWLLFNSQPLSWLLTMFNRYCIIPKHFRPLSPANVDHAQQWARTLWALTLAPNIG